MIMESKIYIVFIILFSITTLHAGNTDKEWREFVMNKVLRTGKYFSDEIEYIHNSKEKLNPKEEVTFVEFKLDGTNPQTWVLKGKFTKNQKQEWTTVLVFDRYSGSKTFTFKPSSDQRELSILLYLTNVIWVDVNPENRLIFQKFWTTRNYEDKESILDDCFGRYSNDYQKMIKCLDKPANSKTPDTVQSNPPSRLLTKEVHNGNKDNTEQKQSPKTQTDQYNKNDQNQVGTLTKEVHNGKKDNTEQKQSPKTQTDQYNKNDQNQKLENETVKPQYFWFICIGISLIGWWGVIKCISSCDENNADSYNTDDIECGGYYEGTMDTITHTEEWKNTARMSHEFTETADKEKNSHERAQHVESTLDLFTDNINPHPESTDDTLFN